jgi:hypothetical protein
MEIESNSLENAYSTLSSITSQPRLENTEKKLSHPKYETQ